MPPSKSDYFFFWRPQDTNGWAGQWYRSPFTARLSAAIPYASDTLHTFPTAEHWMMACKAALFSDTTTLDLILEENTKPDADPKRMRALGRRITPFDEETWVEHREHIVYLGNLFKFRQNEELKRLLLGTGELVLVEASPSDNIWGIGSRESKAMEKEWRGLNLLGQALMKVREELAREQQAPEVEMVDCN